MAFKLVRHIIDTAEASHRPPAAEEYTIKLSDKDTVNGPPKKPEVAPRAVISSMYLHVQVDNDEARTFWEGHGFVVTVSLNFAWSPR